MKNAKKLLATLSLSAMMLNVAVVPASAITLEMTGNGVDSDNEIQLETEQKTEVSQENEFNVDNNINASANTGSNSASRNTGGDASIDTGNATSEVVVQNAGNLNEAVVDCCASAGNATVLISENGDSTDNKVTLENENEVEVSQENESHITNRINNDATTGWNDANRNTGGSVTITTGKAEASTGIFNGGNINSAIVSGSGSQGGVSARILGNGVDSDNEIELDLDHKVELSQENSARISNYVDTDAVSGKNDANRNTGGDVTIDTGDAEATVIVDNEVNFNFAEVDCGCLFDVTAKIAGNGDSSDNKIKAELEDELEVAQENSCKDRHHGWPWEFSVENFWFPQFDHEDECLTNDIYADAFSGWNETDRNTGEADSDPSVETGNAETTVEVWNAGNSNVFGDVSDWELPGDGEGNHVDIDISFDLEALLELLEGLMA